MVEDAFKLSATSTKYVVDANQIWARFTDDDERNDDDDDDDDDDDYNDMTMRFKKLKPHLMGDAVVFGVVTAVVSWE